MSVFQNEKVLRIGKTVKEILGQNSPAFLPNPPLSMPTSLRVFQAIGFIAERIVLLGWVAKLKKKTEWVSDLPNWLNPCRLIIVQR